MPAPDDEQPSAPNQRTFSLKSREFYEAACEPRERPWIPNGALTREPRGSKAEDGVWLDAETREAAVDALGEWRRRVASADILSVGSSRTDQTCCARRRPNPLRP